MIEKFKQSGEDMQRLTNVGGFSNITEYVNYKIERFSQEEKNCKTLFKYMFSERENTMAETSDGYRIKKLTYGRTDISARTRRAQ